jgi:hypothetical protein
LSRPVQEAPVIDLTIPPGRAPDTLVSEARHAVFDRVADARDGHIEWPPLSPAIQELRAAQYDDDPERLDRALLASATAHIGELARLRSRDNGIRERIQRAAVSETLSAVFTVVGVTRDEPPQLEPAVIGVRGSQGRDRFTFSQALTTSAVAHIAALARLRAEYDVGDRA